MTFEEAAAASQEKPIEFFGVDNLRFKLGGLIFEAVEDESDGYRSYLDSVQVKPDASDIFIRLPLARVRIEKIDHGSFDGWHLVDADDSHVWLTVGTDNVDDYYPSFEFNYHPKPPPAA